MNRPETQSLRERWDAEAAAVEVGCGEGRIVRALAPKGLLIPRSTGATAHERPRAPEFLEEALQAFVAAILEIGLLDRSTL